MKKLDKQKFKGDKGKTHTEKVYDYLHKNYDPVMHYENGAVLKYAGNNGFGYTGRKIEYSDGYARITFVDSFGDELVKVNGELLRGESAGHLRVGGVGG